MLGHGVQCLACHAESMLCLAFIDGAKCLYTAIFRANNHAGA